MSQSRIELRFRNDLDVGRVVFRNVKLFPLVFAIAGMDCDIRITGSKPEANIIFFQISVLIYDLQIAPCSSE
ncbi:hypothetical protein CONCODRAFT_2539 [Conidiobolus coronatus NRRL 28638]|uniref:Uncharacterized protein n=1 Tax=Conidiobolus coronatus (strain ATCC 28846 / CBS 209.66 / NRRL 28638) TaxID=796925 RepID=A0A137PH89_CONC2|nr:hypothetical protein CONCODRAFT_2539 [Conidiobolus coronatus NRRL 28638]|eukprot:KXN74335.1 hypothetical protein CONCODRAFT_2539 [Conidiobolus coronatus NRRL 28638]